MSSLFCSLTGVIPEEPVFSKTGYLFEKRVIEKYLQSNGDVCPVTGETLTLEDLTLVKNHAVVKPRPATLTSIPECLSKLGEEWDSLLLEVFNLRTHVYNLQKQLSHSLYQHDAACRVIARLIKDNNNLEEELQKSQKEADSLLKINETRDANQLVETDLSPYVLEKLQNLAKAFLSERKKRSFDDLSKDDYVRSFQIKKTFTPHSSVVPGVTCCRPFHSTNNMNGESNIILTSGVDGMVSIFDLDQEKSVAQLRGHMKKINSIDAYEPNHVIVSGSDDKTVRIWHSNDGSYESYQISYIIRNHNKRVTSVSIHPSGDYFTSSSTDMTWGIYDLNSGRTCRVYRDLPCTMPVVSFHPDGMLIGAAGMNNNIYIYDIKSGTDSTMVLSGHDGPVTSLQFSPNGYYLATASFTQNGVVKLWDLRRSLNFDTIQPVTSANLVFSPYNLKFDESGTYLAVCGENKDLTDDQLKTGCLSLYYFESRSTVKFLTSLDSHDNLVTDACFGKNASYLVSSSMNRVVNFWAP